MNKIFKAALILTLMYCLCALLGTAIFLSFVHLPLVGALLVFPIFLLMLIFNIIYFIELLIKHG